MGVPTCNETSYDCNNDLPAVELRFERSKKEAATLEFEKQILLENFTIKQSDNNDAQNTRLYRLDYEKEMERLRHLQQKIIKQEDLIKHFENNNEEYLNIRKTVEEKVNSILSDSKMLLKLALLSLSESMKKDPDKFNAFIFCDNKSSFSTPQTRGYSQYYDTASYGHGTAEYPSQDYISVLVEESEKLSQ